MTQITNVTRVLPDRIDFVAQLTINAPLVNAGSEYATGNAVDLRQTRGIDPTSFKRVIPTGCFS